MRRVHTGIFVAMLVGCGDDGGDASTVTEASGSATAGDDDGGTSTAPGSTSTPPSDDDGTSGTTDAPGTSSTTTPSGSSGDGSSGEPPVMLLFEEDFETGAPGEPPDPTKWELATGAGTVELSTDRSVSGVQSLLVTSPSGSYETFIRTTVPFPVADNTFWGRLYFYVEELPVDDFVHWTVMEARGSDSNNRVRIGGINNPHGGDFFSNTYILNIETQGMGEIGASDPLESPAGQWICLEWQYAGTPGANEARVFIDGAESDDMHSLDDFFDGVYQMPMFDRLYVGWGIYQPISFPYRVWIDDVAVHDERIGC